MIRRLFVKTEKSWRGASKVSRHSGSHSNAAVPAQLLHGAEPNGLYALLPGLAGQGLGKLGIGVAGQVELLDAARRQRPA